MDEIKKESKKNKKHYDRITLLNSNIKSIENLITQVRDEFPSLPEIQIKDMVNFIIEIRGNEFSKAELMQIYKQLFDPIKIMKLATQDLIEAKKSGIILSLQEALKKYETPGVSKNQTALSGSRKIKKAETIGELNHKNENGLIDLEDIKGPLISASQNHGKSAKIQHSDTVFEKKNQVEKRHV